MPMRATRRAGNQAQAHDGVCRGGQLRLLRQTHIFSSVVREFLALKPMREASRAPISLSQLHALKLMSLNGPQQVGQVAGLLGVSAPAATKTIDKLEALGFVARSHSGGDRRATLLLVSPRGRQLLRRYDARKAQRLGPVLAAFDEPQIARLTHDLERFSLALLGTELEGDGGTCLRCDMQIEPQCPVGRLRGGCPYEALSAPPATPQTPTPAGEPFAEPRGPASRGPA